MIRCLTLPAALLIVCHLPAMGPENHSLRQALATRVAPIHAQLTMERSALGLDAHHDFRAESLVVDERGDQYIRFHQMYRGLRVWGGESIVRTDRAGNRKDSAIHALYPVTDLSVDPSLSLDKAEAVGLDRMARVSGIAPGGSSETTGELLIYPIKRQVRVASARNKPQTLLNALDVQDVADRYALAYLVRVRQALEGRMPVCRDMMIDAHSGVVLAEWNALMTAPARGTGKTLYSGAVTLDTNYTGTVYQLKDLTRSTSPYFYVQSTDNPTNVFGDHTTNNPLTVAADALWGLHSFYDVLLNCYNWKGLDSNNKGLGAIVHLKSSESYYQNGSVYFGDGDGFSVKPLVSLDIVGHEAAHGLCESTVNLTYTGESGGLNESNSDIIGELSEFYGKSGKSGNVVPFEGGDWQVGGEIGSPLRYFKKPSLDGVSKDYWYSGIGNIDVHHSSGPSNRMFYFLAQGSTPTGITSSSFLQYGPIAGIGIHKAGAIWIRALTTRMTSGTNYAGALSACKVAAEELYGVASMEARTVQRAFAAINVGTDIPMDGSLIITSQPANQTVASGASATFTVTVTGGAEPYVYQWHKNGQTVGSNAASFTFTAQMADDGAKIHAEVTDSSNPAKKTISDEATLILLADPTTGSELIQNGGFEQGTAPWAGTTSVISDWSSIQPAYEGMRCAFFGGKGSAHTQTLHQTVTIPSTALSASLSFQLKIATAEASAKVRDKLLVQVRDSSGTVLKTLATYSNLDKSTAYILRNFDLTAHKGKTIRVYFNMTENSSYLTSFAVDKVELTVK